MEVYAIMRSGNRHIRYSIRRATESGMTAPIDGKLYRSAEEAQAAAAAAGIRIDVIGDGYDIAAYVMRR